MADRMGPRELKSLLGILRAAGVTSYANGDLRVEFQSTGPFAAGTPGDRETDGDDTTGTGILELPDGVLDPVKVIQNINRLRTRAS